jgi:hypothetical protein
MAVAVLADMRSPKGLATGSPAGVDGDFGYAPPNLIVKTAKTVLSDLRGSVLIGIAEMVISGGSPV